jgi:hypothetical protein
MITSNANTAKNDGGRNRRETNRADVLTKMAANAFISNVKDDDDEDEGKGNILDQRRINEIFVRLKVAEISSLYFAILGIL